MHCACTHECCHPFVTWFLTNSLPSALLGSPAESGADLSSGLWERGGWRSHLECDCMFLPAGTTPAPRLSAQTHASWQRSPCASDPAVQQRLQPPPASRAEPLPLTNTPDKTTRGNVDGDITMFHKRSMEAAFCLGVKNLWILSHNFEFTSLNSKFYSEFWF